jgi:hypothetical protein
MEAMKIDAPMGTISLELLIAAMPSSRPCGTALGAMPLDIPLAMRLLISLGIDIVMTHHQ